MRWLFCASVVLFAAAYSYVCIVHYTAYRRSAGDNASALRTAVEIEPWNADYWMRLGSHQLYADLNSRAAVESYRQAAAQNPRIAGPWLEMAMAYEFDGNVAAQQDALQRASSLEPTNPNIALAAGSFFAVHDETELALKQLRRVLENDPARTDEALTLCWRVAPDARRLLADAIPPEAPLYVQFLNHLLRARAFEQADYVWNELIHLNQPLDFRAGYPYVNHLIETGNGDALLKSWTDLASISPALQRYVPADNRVVNGDFEFEILNSGLDWTYSEVPGAMAKIDASQFYSGGRSLRVDYHARSVGDIGLFEFVPVKPNTGYRLSAAVRSEELETANGPRVEITDIHGKHIASTEEVVGTSTWQVQQSDFQTPGVNLVRIGISRETAGTAINGRYWVDDVRLVRR